MLSESTASVQKVNVALEIGRVVTKFADEQLKEAERKREAKDNVVEEQRAAQEAAQRDATSSQDAEGGGSEGVVLPTGTGESSSGVATNGTLVDIQV